MTPDQIRTTRTSLGLSQAEFGRLLGVDGNYVSRIERGAAAPSAPLALLIALLDDESTVRRLERLRT